MAYKTIYPNPKHLKYLCPYKGKCLTLGKEDKPSEIKGIGTFCFTIEDDNGMVHSIEIPDSFYLPDLRLTLLVPQHLSKTSQDNVPQGEGTGRFVTSNVFVLFWNQHTV